MEVESEYNQEEVNIQKNHHNPQAGSLERKPMSRLAFHISADGDIAMTKSMAGAVIADQNLEMTNSSTQAAVAGADINFTNSSSKITVAGNNIYLTKSHTSIIKAGGDAELTGSHVSLLAGSQVTANKSKIVVVFSRQTNLGEGSQVLINTPQAVALGASFGIVMAFVNWLLKRKK
jgi:hypothetical protein